jgi:hypothetical protein
VDSRFDLVRILQTAVWVVTSPVSFFKAMPRSGGFVEPLIFMVVMGLIGASLQAVFSNTGLQPLAFEMDSLSLIIMLTFAIVVSGFIAAGIYFVIWRLMGSQGNYELAYRCNAYMSALIPVTTVINLIPDFAPVISIVISTIFLVIASVYVHNLPMRKSSLVFGALGLIFIMLSVTSDIAMRKKASEMDIQEQHEAIEEPGQGIIEGLKDI